MKGDEKKPKIRFKGYINEWENRELSNLLVLLKDGTHGTHKDVKDGAYLLSAKNIKDGEIYIDDSDRKISFEEFQKIHSHFTLQKGDVLVTIVGTIGETAIMGNIENITFQRSVAYLRTSCKLYNYFLLYEIATQRFQFELENRRSVSAQPGIYLGELARIPINYPGDITEQEKIGCFFNDLDNIITLQQQKYNQLVNMKQTLLEKMFPRDGEKVPEIRFDGFEDDWKYHKLGEILTVKDSARVPNSLWGKQGIRYLRSSDLGSNKAEGLFISEETYEMYKKQTGAPEKGDVLFASGGDIGLSYYYDGKEPIYVQGGAILYIKTSRSLFVDGRYLKEYFESPRMQEYIEGAAAGGTIKHFTLAPCNNAPLYYPTLSEQKKIGQFFVNIDNVITTQQKKIDHLKNIKQSFQDKMFVS